MTLPSNTSRNGGQILVQQLRNQGVRRAFLVPGESFLPCIDALYDHQDAIQTIVCRQESGAAYMAEAYGKLTGEPGVCFVTRGPGATNASIGVHTAFQDSTPLVLFVGQVGSDFADREAFQEIDYRRMFGQMTKWVAQIDRTERIPEYIARAFSVATSGRPGPVVLALPEDTLWGHAEVPDIACYTRTHAHPSMRDMDRLCETLETADRPFMLIGGSGWTTQALTQMKEFAGRFDLPVGVSWRRLECFDQQHASFAGHVGWGMTAALRHRVQDADVLLSVCARLGEATTEGYTLVTSPKPQQQLIHVYPDASELGRVYQPMLAITADPVGFAAAVAELKPSKLPSWGALTRTAHAEYRESLIALSSPSAMSLDAAACHVNAVLPRDACVTAGAGNYALYPHRYRQFGGIGTSLAPTVGSMGYGLPAALSAKLEHPDRTVVCYAGDGCFQMNMQELGVAMQYRLGVVILVFNNGMWGTIRAHQEREFPGRCWALTFDNPEFTEVIRAYRGYGEIVTSNEQFVTAFARALAFCNSERLPALLEIRYDADGIGPGQMLSQIRSTALEREAVAVKQFV